MVGREMVWVTTTVPLQFFEFTSGGMIARTRPAGSRCVLSDEDDRPGTWVLVDERGDEAWEVSERQFVRDGGGVW